MAADRFDHLFVQPAAFDATLAFYRDVLGFQIMQRYGSQAVFLSAGGYHHHLGLNTWGTRDAPPPPAGARGLDRYRVVLPSEDDVAAAGERLPGCTWPRCRIPTAARTAGTGRR